MSVTVEIYKYESGMDDSVLGSLGVLGDPVTQLTGNRR
jgi:hypothetical protein